MSQYLQNLVLTVNAYVFGLPAGPRGEDVAAVVVPATDAELKTGDLSGHALELLSSFKVPRHWLILAEADVPMTATGKPDVSALREVLRARLAGDPGPARSPGAPPASARSEDT